IFLLVNTGIHERNRFALGMDESRYVVQNEEVWIPLETTALSKGFAEAWWIGAESYRSWEARGRIELIDVALAQSKYEPGIPAGEIVLPTLDTTALQTHLRLDLRAIATAREVHFDERYGEDLSDRTATPEALNEVARVYYSVGRWGEAKAELVRALASGTEEARTRNNLGAVFAAEGDLEQAAEAFQAAADLDHGDPGIWLNLGIVRYAMGDSVNAEVAFARGLDQSGSYEKACSLLGIAPEPDLTREGTKRMTAEEARELLRASLRRVPRAVDRVVPPSAAPASKSPKRWRARTAGARSSDGTNLADLLYWKT
ncbi:MAG TPA: tetratricopeptide repeat protein, partial [Candidatus Eisenbacteria bacterium]|nr:tetratricopeptide repeat protein [Candidatus Eisenbacteria bacterium]